MLHWFNVRSTKIALGFLVVFFVHALSLIPQKSITIDEPAMIATGLAFLRTGDISMGADTPPLVKLWSALPLVFVDVSIPWDGNGWRDRVHWMFGNELFAANPPPTYHDMIYWARLPMILIACALGWLVFVWARTLAGGAAALAALLLFTLEPNILAHSILVKTDIAASFVYLLFFFVLHKYLHQPSTLRAGTLGLVLGIGLLTKLSMLALLPVCVLCLFLRWLAPKLVPLRPEHPAMRPLQGAYVTWHFIAILTLTTLLVHTGYGFEAFRPSAIASTATSSGFWSSLAPILPADLPPRYGYRIHSAARRLACVPERGILQ